MHTTLEAPSFHRHLKELGIRYQGQSKIHGRQTYFFHDLRTNTNFRTADLADLASCVTLHRENFYHETK